MTRKDYVRIAGAVSEATKYMDLVVMSDAEKLATQHMRRRIVMELCAALRRDNPNFNEERFRTACLG